MEKYKIVYIFTNCGNAMFTIMHSGVCIYQERRDVGFRMKCENYGDAFEMVLEPEENPFGNPFCRIVDKIEADDKQRLKNLIDATHLIIENLYSTKAEQKQTVEIGNEYYVSGLYYQVVLKHFIAIKKYFLKLKDYKKAKQIQVIIDDYSNDNELYMMYRPKEIIAMGKRKFSIFLTNKRILKNIQLKLKLSSLSSLQKIENVIIFLL